MDPGTVLQRVFRLRRRHVVLPRRRRALRGPRPAGHRPALRCRPGQRRAHLRRLLRARRPALHPAPGLVLRGGELRHMPAARREARALPTATSQVRRAHAHLHRSSLVSAGGALFVYRCFAHCFASIESKSAHYSLITT